MVAFALLVLSADLPTVAAAALGFAMGRTIMPSVRLLSGDAERWDALLTSRHVLLVRLSGVMTSLAIGLLALVPGGTGFSS